VTLGSSWTQAPHPKPHAMAATYIGCYTDKRHRGSSFILIPFVFQPPAFAARPLLQRADAGSW